MKRLNSYQIGIADGFVSLVDHWAESTVMWGGDGERTVRAKVLYDEPFHDVPAVTLTIAVLDADNAAYLRLNLRTEEVSRNGFSLAADTWGDTRIARLGIRWQAIGEATDDEDYWDV